jgi:hypothetical protein
MLNNRKHHEIRSEINKFEILLSDLMNLTANSDIRDLSRTMYSVGKLKNLIESLEDKYYLRCKKEKGE